MSQYNKNEDLESLFTRIVVHSIRWSELLQFPRRLRKSEVLPTKFLQGWTQQFYDSLTDEECAVPYERGLVAGVKFARDSIVSAMFYKNLPSDIKSQIANLDLPYLMSLKDAAVSCPLHH